MGSRRVWRRRGDGPSNQPWALFEITPPSSSIDHTEEELGQSFYVGVTNLVNGQKTKLSFKPSEKISSLKEKLFKLYPDILPEQQCLVHNCQILSDPLRSLDKIAVGSKSFDLLLTRRSKKCMINRYPEMQNSWWYSSGEYNPDDTGSLDGITFSVDRTISISGVGMYGNASGGNYNVGLYLISGNHQKAKTLREEANILGEGFAEYSTSGDKDEVYPIELSAPVRIDAGYTFSYAYF